MPQSATFTFSFLLLLCYASCSYYESIEIDQDLVHWKREGWKKMHRVEQDHNLKFIFALKQQHTKELEETLKDVSYPDSENYGKYLSLDQITEMIKPSEVSISTVKNWLHRNEVRHCELNVNEDFLTCIINRQVAEKVLLGATFYYFKHPEYPGTIIRSVSAYYVPRFVAKHLDFVGGLHRFPNVKAKLKRPYGTQDTKLSIASQFIRAVQVGIGGVYPGVLRQRYNASGITGSHPNNSQAVAQFDKEYYLASDLKKFMDTFVGSEFKHRDTVSKIIGPNSGRAGLEASLDIQYIMGVGANVPTWFWSTPGTIPGTHGNIEPYLAWIVSVGNTKNVPWVHSVSYGRDETEMSVAYMKRMNIEFMKAGARGITILFASGDNGAACEGGKFAPEFPASSPYITSVGGTHFIEPVGVSDEEGDIISGGGFSNIFKQTEYQAEAVNKFLSTAGIPSRKYFNASGRAYPDIAAVCRHFWVVVNGNISPGITGTSASTPTVAGLVGLLNDLRFQHNKPSMGFINPFLYKYAHTMYDITKGCHLGCLQGGSRGFCSSKDWDPVTGNGTPNFPALVKAAIDVFRQ